MPFTGLKLFCKNILIIYSVAIFFVYLLFSFFMGRSKYPKSYGRYAACAFLMTLILMLMLTSGIGAVLSLVLVVSFSDFVKMLGFNGSPTMAHIALLWGFTLPNLLLQFWVPFFIFPHASRKKILIATLIGIFIAFLMYAFAESKCRHSAYGFTYFW